MARNAEKSMTTLARWRQAQEGAAQPRERRPYLATECDNLKEADRWRNQIISEIARKVSQIQNAGLGEFRIRDLNDEINKLLREKGHWEVRIKELGGVDYHKVGPRVTDMDGQEAKGNRGYMYFGAAKDLPGVRELFDQEPPPAVRKSRGDLMKNIDIDYYGYRDDEDAIAIPLEREKEAHLLNEHLKEYKKRKKNKQEEQTDDAEANEEGEISDDDEEELEEIEVEATDKKSEIARFMAYVPNIPTQGDIERFLLERKKKELLKQVFGE